MKLFTEAYKVQRWHHPHIPFYSMALSFCSLACSVVLPMVQLIVQKKSDELIRAWRLAHGALSLGATTMIAMAAAFPLHKEG